ncbi:MAG: GAF domain-containing protein [Stellaceae bacterium]
MRTARSRAVAKTRPVNAAMPPETAAGAGLEERYALVCQAVAEGIYEWDIERNTLSPSARLIEIFGFEGRSLGADDWNTIVHPDDFPIYRAALRDCFRGVTARLNCEYRIRHSDGAYRWIEDRALPIRNMAGRAIRLVGAVSDVTERKEAEHALREALERQTATAEILRVISSSPTDVQPTFDAIAAAATTLSGASSGGVFRFDGRLIHFVAHYGWTAAELDAVHGVFPLPPGRGSITARAILTRAVAHVADMTADPEFEHLSLGQGGIRATLSVPMLRDGTPVGAITVTRRDVEPFSDKQIALLQTFADQAVIAIENVRLFNELNERTKDLQESLEYQTATSEVLQVISRSTFDLQPVLDTLVETAARLCEADNAGLSIRDGEVYRYVATVSIRPEVDALIRDRSYVPSRASVLGRTVLERQVVHIEDLATDSEHDMPEAVTIGKMRTMLGVPLMRAGDVVGTITLTRQRVAPFTKRQIELVRTFADQAVIAIENARLITETREALEQQTATAEVLGVINSSPGDLAPVFAVMLERATLLCEAHTAHLLRYEAPYFTRAASLGVSEDFDKILPLNTPVPHIITQDSIPYRMLASRSVIHVADAREDERAGAPAETAAAASGIRTALFVPLLKEGEVVGCFVMHRLEVRPFTDKQIALLQNFAAQAVIAMENARLLGELHERTRDLQESLEYQTATSEVLEVISRSTFDLQPVLDTLVETAARLCMADQAVIFRRSGELHELSANFGFPAEYEAYARARGLSALPPNSVTAEAAREGRVIHVDDVAADPDYPMGSVTLGKQRTTLGVPLVREGEPIGVLSLARQRVEPFTERQIELVRTFADQAVIAIENTRLITETREALEQQTATAEVLQVINSSPGELAPVFEAILDKAMRLCGAAFGIMAVTDDDQARTVAAHGLPPALAEWRRNNPIVSPKGTLFARVLAGEPFVHTLDLRDDDLYRREEPLRRANVDLGGARTSLYVPLMREREVLGTIHIYRQEVRPFSEKQIALLQSFAAQAVIAMDNARLLGEIRQRQEELRVTFDNMGDGVAMFDAELRLAAWNLNFQTLLDLPEAFLTERPSLSEYFHYLAGRGEYPADLAAELSRGVEIPEHETRFERERPDGRILEVRRNAVPGGGCVLIYGDITERKRAEAEIRAARDAAEAALSELKTAQANLIQAEKMASLGQLTAGIAHEIKNPLNFVNNFAGLSVELLDELKTAAGPAIAELGEDTRAEVDETIEMLTGNLQKIAEHGRRADGIVRSMLEHSRGATGDRRSVDLNTLVEEALNLAYHGARAQDQNFNITLEREFGAAIAPVELVPQDVTRVFLNLIGNGFYAANKRRQAADASFKPTLTVTTRDLGDAVEIAVRDNGIGIGPELRDRLFQPFFTTKPTGEGTGLGLSISYDIVTQQHGGSIAVDSEVGEYTEFTVRLPRERQRPPAS